jgi:hypothetical protein
LEIQQPQILSEHFKNGLPFLEIMPGKNKEEYEQTLEIRTLSNNKSGCTSYSDEFKNFKGRDSGSDFGLLLVDSDNCSLSTKIHFAQLADAKVLLLKYVDDKIEEAEVVRSSFEGVRIPIFMLKASDAQYINDVLHSEGSQSQLRLKLTHVNEIDRSSNKIQIYMSSLVTNNPMISFLSDLKDHSKIFSKYQIEIRYLLSFCKSCKQKNWLRREQNCLSGGRYCVISSDYKTNQPTLETLRQICIRKVKGTDLLINYLIDMKKKFDAEERAGSFSEANFQLYSETSMKNVGIEAALVQQCVDGSFVSKTNDGKVEVNLDDNTLLSEEQQEFLKITKYNIFPLIIINKVQYDRSINIRDFIRFGCQNHLFDCRGFKGFKKTFLVVLVALALVFVFVIVAFCRRVLKKKMDNEMNIKVNAAIKKYLTVDKV